MKLSKSLLQSIMFGLTIGAATTSCELLGSTPDVKPDTCDESCSDDCTTDHGGGEIYCPACGLG